MSKINDCHGCGDNVVTVDNDYKEKFCCGGGMWEQCGCMGLPINPVFCEKCERKIFKEHELDNS